MGEGFGGVVLALARSFATLASGRAWAYLLGPGLVALLLWLLLAFAWMGELIAWTLGLPPFSWLLAWDFTWLARFLAAISVWLAILSFIYLTATLLASIFVLPLLLEWVAGRDYRDVARMGSDSTLASAANSLWTLVLYLGGWLLTLPLWLIPGFGLFVPVFWLAWLNRRTFAFDALIAHATGEESRLIRRREAKPMLTLGLLLAVLAYIPLFGLLVPTLSALAYVHFTLESLRRLRQGAVVTATAVVVDEAGNKRGKA